MAEADHVEELLGRVASLEVRAEQRRSEAAFALRAMTAGADVAEDLRGVQGDRPGDNLGGNLHRRIRFPAAQESDNGIDLLVIERPTVGCGEGRERKST